MTTAKILNITFVTQYRFAKFQNISVIWLFQSLKSNIPLKNRGKLDKFIANRQKTSKQKNAPMEKSVLQMT